MKCALRQDSGAAGKAHDPIARFYLTIRFPLEEGAFLRGVKFPGPRAAVGVTPCKSLPSSRRRVSPGPRPGAAEGMAIPSCVVELVPARSFELRVGRGVPQLPVRAESGRTSARLSSKIHHLLLLIPLSGSLFLFFFAAWIKMKAS